MNTAIAQAQDDDAEFVRELMDGARVNGTGEICLGWTNIDRLERIATRLSVTTPDTTVLVEEIERLTKLLNTPEVDDFAKGVVLEAAHQRERWGAEHDSGKTPFDWFWLVGYLAQKAAASAVAGNTEKALHHTISTGAALANWHLALKGKDTSMRPGIGPENGGEKPGSAFDLASKLDSNAALASTANPTGETSNG